MNLFDITEDAIVASESVSAKAVTLYKETCKNCRGTGIWVAYTRSAVGPCYSCKGVGYHEFKTSATEREKNRNYARDSKARRESVAVHNFQRDYPAEYNWIMDAKATFDFANSMYESVKKYGSLTEKQLAAVQKCVAKKAAAVAEREAREQSAQAVSIEAVEVAFNNAKQSGIKYPRLRLDGFTFSPATKNEAIYVKEGEQYLGKVLGGKFLKVRECNDEQESRIIAAANDPKKAAVAYGHKFGNCAVCGRELSDKESVERGIGPICASRFGW